MTGVCLELLVYGEFEAHFDTPRYKVFADPIEVTPILPAEGGFGDPNRDLRDMIDQLDTFVQIPEYWRVNLGEVMRVRGDNLYLYRLRYEMEDGTERDSAFNVLETA